MAQAHGLSAFKRGRYPLTQTIRYFCVPRPQREAAREEANGHIRWLHPSFQSPQTSLAVDSKNGPKTPSTASDAAPAMLGSSKHPWPPSLPDQMALLIRLLNTTAQSESHLAAQITGKGPLKKSPPRPPANPSRPRPRPAGWRKLDGGLMVYNQVITWRSPP